MGDTTGDPAGLACYMAAQEPVDVFVRDRRSVHKKALRNIARVGKLSSDRTITQYAREIGNLRPAVVGHFAHAALLEGE